LWGRQARTFPHVVLACRKQLPAQERSRATNLDEIPLQAKGKALYLPVRINDTITIPFLLDTGAEELALPVDVATTLMRAGALGSRDVLGEVGLVLADGSKQVVPRISIREVKVGNQTLRDVPATVSPSAAEPLLGQAFLSRFGSVTLDYSTLAALNTAPTPVITPQPTRMAGSGD